MPEPIDTECMTYWDNRTEDCEARVDRMWQQCDALWNHPGEDEYSGQPWMWTEACDALELIEEGFAAIEHYDQCGDDSDCEVDSEDEDEDDFMSWWSNDLSKKVSYRMRKNPAKYTALTSALMHKPTAAAIDSESAGFDTGAAATGFGIGLVGFLAVAGIAKMLRREQSSKAEQSQECLL